MSDVNVDEQGQGQGQQGTATLETVLRVMIAEMMLDAQDPHVLRATCPLAMLMQPALVHVALCNRCDDAVTMMLAQDGLVFRQTVSPVEPWPVVVQARVTPTTPEGQCSTGYYVFAKRIPHTEPEQMNKLLVALAHEAVEYSVS